MNANRTMAALVRAFFEAYAKGVLDATPAHGGEASADMARHNYPPQETKRAMLNHYEDIHGHFFDVMFYVLAQMNYEDAQAVSQAVRQNCGTAPSRLELLKAACRTESLYNDMAEEYRRNFTLLLQGRFSTLEEHVNAYLRGDTPSLCDERMALRLLARTVLRAYAAGLKTACPQLPRLQQLTIYRILIYNANILLREKPFASTTGTVESLLLEACRNEENLVALMEEVNSLYGELAQ